MLKDKKEVIKHSAAIQSENRFGLLERRGPGRINVYIFGKPYLLIFQV